MKQFRKLIAILLAMILCISTFSMTAFAAETDADEERSIPENATRHTIELTVEPGEVLDDSGIAPYVWGEGSTTTSSGGYSRVPLEQLFERYLAFEATAVSSSGSPVNGTFSVSVLYSGTYSIASMTADVDGQMHKLDWITITNIGGSHQLHVYNGTPTTIIVHIVYYTWD